MRYISAVYEVVKGVPKGKVVTYGYIAKLLDGYGVTPRMVGRALHLNQDSESVPCHRVVNSRGMVAKSYAFGGAEGQKRKLMAEGVVFLDSLRVDFKRHLI